MPDPNVANTVTILGKTDVAAVSTHWKTLVYNDTQARAALKINSLFLTNKSASYNVEIDVRIARMQQATGGAILGRAVYTNFLSAMSLVVGYTVIAISRDNPIWLEPGDALQVLASRNYWVEAVCSYEYISDTGGNPYQTTTTPGQVLNLNASQMHSSNGGVQLAWTPPFDDGGDPITNYVVQYQSVTKGTAPLTGAVVYNYGTWYSLHKPASPTVNYSVAASIFEPEYSFPVETASLLSPSHYTQTLPLSTARLSLSMSKGIDPTKTLKMTSGLVANSVSYSDPQGPGGPKIIPFTTFTGSGSNVGVRFRVAAYNARGLGIWSDPSETILVNKVEPPEVNVIALPNRAELTWTSGEFDSAFLAAGGNVQLYAHKVRWSDDNGMTWIPNPSGQRLESPALAATVGNLQNGTYYAFSVQSIYLVTGADGSSFEVSSPWSAPIENVIPPGNDFEALEAATSSVWVRWV